MQLDNTRIAIRERGVLETLDLSLHVLRRFALPLLAAWALGVAPLMLLNHLLIGWMADIDYREESPGRFIWNMALLVFIQAPLASAFAASYLGQAVFLERPSLRHVVRDIRKMLPQLAWCQLLVRGVAPACVLVITIDRYNEFNPWVEAFLLPLLALYAAGLRSLRPYVNEIILLERNPLRARDSATMTIGRRSAWLHSASGGDLFLRWIVSAAVGVWLVLAFYVGCWFLSGVLLNDWRHGPLLIELCLPLSMWIVAGFMAVFRFLSYLDLRIRHEGWEVELKMRAEAARLANNLLV